MYRFGCSAKLASMLAAHCVVSQILMIYPLHPFTCQLQNHRPFRMEEILVPLGIRGESCINANRSAICTVWRFWSQQVPQTRSSLQQTNTLCDLAWSIAHWRVRGDKSLFRSCGIHGHETYRYSVEWDLTFSGIDSTWSQRHVKRHIITKASRRLEDLYTGKLWRS